MQGKHIRPDWDNYFLGLLEPLSRRATCDRGRCSAVIVSKSNTILATGYVGAPPGQPHCDEVGHLLKTIVDQDGNESQHCVRTLHAEENAILQGAREGVKVLGATLYCKMVPCYNCAMRIVRVGIDRVVAEKRYHADKATLELFKNAGVELKVIENTNQEYTNQ